ncbi:MAG TPA: hypothetical protein VFU21_16315 [Kofleriaceae bacterium]|nr:hypothetical protein [Kofleriaceae bacterium]
MNEERLGSPREFAERLGEHLARFAEDWLPLPDAADLTALVDITFFASLHEEESRRVQFDVAWQATARDCAAVVELSRPVRATPKGLMKLAPATRLDATSIAIRREQGELVAWALLERIGPAQGPLTIRVLAPGVLRVDYAGRPRALFARGETFLVGGEHEVISPAVALGQAFTAWGGVHAHPDLVPLPAVIVGEIATRALEHGHGGMLLIVPASVAEPVGVRIHYPIGEGADILARRYTEVTSAAVRPGEPSRPRGLGEAIELVARLTAVDNAVLIDTDLRLRGFGVQVIEGDAPDMSFEHVDPYSQGSHIDDLSTFKGTRHPAGVVFCMRQQQEAAALIASQDGRLSLALKDAGGRVRVLGTYERAFGVLGWR